MTLAVTFHFRRKIINLVKSLSAAWGLGLIRNTLQRPPTMESGLGSVLEEKRIRNQVLTHYIRSWATHGKKNLRSRTKPGTFAFLTQIANH